MSELTEATGPIVYPISLPDSPVPRVTVLHGISANSITESPYTGDEEIQAYRNAERLSIEVEYPPIPERAVAARLIATLLSLHGAEGTFLLGDEVNDAPRGSGAGSPVVDGDHQSGSRLATRGWTSSQAGVLKMMDWIQVVEGGRTRLHASLRQVNSDGDGKAVIDIYPALRAAPEDGAAIVLNGCVGEFRLADDDCPWTIDEVCWYGVKFTAVEAR